MEHNRSSFEQAFHAAFAHLTATGIPTNDAAARALLEAKRQIDSPQADDATASPIPQHSPAPSSTAIPIEEPVVLAERVSTPVIQLLLAQCQEAGRDRPLVHWVGRTLATPESLSASFGLPTADQSAMEVTDAGPGNDNQLDIDLEEIDGCWRLLYSRDSEAVHNSILNALRTMVDKLPYLPPKQTAQPEFLRLLMFVLEHPRTLDPDLKDVLRYLFRAMARLPPGNRDLLVELFQGVGRARFRKYMGAVQQYITLRIYGGGEDGVMDAVEVLEILYDASAAPDLGDSSCHGCPDCARRRQGLPPIKYTEFYNDAINQELLQGRNAMHDHYNKWRDDLDAAEAGTEGYKRGSLFSFPFVMDPASKAQVLDLHSRVQMHQEIRAQVEEVMAAGEEPNINPYLVVRVRREHIVADTLHNLLVYEETDLKKPLKVKFIGEEGEDAGGVQKEYFQVMVRQLLDPKYAMFKQDAETRALWFNSDTLEAGEEFELVGKLLGLAIYNGIILNVSFPMVVYRRLMDLPPTLEDLKEAQPLLGKGLQALLDFEGDVEATFQHSFQISYEVWGEIKTFDLKEGGGSIPVTKENREEYVQLYVDWVMNKSVQRQYDPFHTGFHKVCGGVALQLFRPDELELLICGNPHLDFEALESVTQYEEPYSADSDVIRHFWEVVHELSDAEKRRLLKFATGSDRAPINGLESLTFIISKNGDDSDRLPTAHTCFNHVLLPSYASKDKVAQKLRLAIENAEGFGLR